MRWWLCDAGFVCSATYAGPGDYDPSPGFAEENIIHNRGIKFGPKSGPSLSRSIARKSPEQQSKRGLAHSQSAPAGVSTKPPTVPS